MTEVVPDGGTQPVESAPDQQPQPAAAGEQTPAPWQSDLQQRFPDEDVRGRVDEYVRETVQPYITRLEQDSAEDRYAKKLWDDFTQDPAGTYLAVTREMFGDDAAQEAEQLLDTLGNEGEDVPTGDLESVFDEEDLPPRYRQAVDAWEDQQREDAYYDELDRVAAANEDLGLDDDDSLFHPFVSAAEGDFDLAVEGYRSFLSRFKPAGAGESEQAPPAIGSDVAAQTTPPTETAYETLDDALDAMFDEEKTAPTVVGST